MTFKRTLCAALDRLGADSGRFQFDDYSTIAISFDDVGDIFLEPQPDERVLMWGLMEELDEKARNELAVPLLAEAMRPGAHWESGAPVLRLDGRVGGLLSRDCVNDPGQLAVALRDFHECLERLQSIK
jgi:hypothetical protein